MRPGPVDERLDNRGGHRAREDVEVGRGDWRRKAAQEVASQFNRQILEEVQRRQKDGDDVDIKTVFESFDTDGNGVLTRKELVVGLREFGIKMSKDEKEKLLEILDEVRNFAFVHALAE